MKTILSIVQITFSFNKIEVIISETVNAKLWSSGYSSPACREHQSSNKWYKLQYDFFWSWLANSNNSRRWRFVNVFQDVVAELRKKCVTMQELLIRRPHIVEDALGYYKDETLFTSNLYVQFDWERGDDLNGGDNFWTSFRGQVMHRNAKFMFRISPGKLLTSLKLKALGRLLWHGFILWDYLSIFINHVILYVALTRHMPSTNFQYSCFLESVSTTNSEVINLVSDAATFDEYL